MNEGLIDTIARLCELLDRETAGLRQGNSGVVADARQRKAQAFMELSRALSGLPEREAKDARLRAALRDLHAKLADNARVAAAAAAQATFVFDGRRLARALVPAILLFPLLVIADVWLLRFVHETLAGFLPRAFSTWLVLSYAALLAALGCLVFGAIPLLVERQAPLLVWKEDHVGT